MTLWKWKSFDSRTLAKIRSHFYSEDKNYPKNLFILTIQVWMNQNNNIIAQKILKSEKLSLFSAEIASYIVATTSREHIIVTILVEKWFQSVLKKVRKRLLNTRFLHLQDMAHLKILWVVFTHYNQNHQRKIWLKCSRTINLLLDLKLEWFLKWKMKMIESSSSRFSVVMTLFKYIKVQIKILEFGVENF